MTDYWYFEACPSCKKSFNNVGEDFGFAVPAGETFYCPFCKAKLICEVELKILKGGKHGNVNRR
jgi:hypothetical protein